MKANYTYNEGLLKLYFTIDEDDTPIYQNIKMVKNIVEIKLPKDLDINKVHPDILALSIILISYPFIKSKLTLPFGVSKVFHDHFEDVGRKEIFPIDYNLKPREVPLNGVPALAYSGGIDSTAALTLMPRTTVAVFLDRIQPEAKKNIYNKEAAHYACKSLRKLGRSVYMIESDLEYIREPVGFPVDIAVAVPILLLADYIGFDSVAFGTLSGAYKIYNPTFREYSKAFHYRLWGKCFEIIGIPFNQVTLGLTEICSTKIAIKSPYYDFTQSCMRGKIKNPCLGCWKCFRKILLMKILSQEDIDDMLLDKLFKSNVQYSLFKFPIKEESTIAYICSRYKGEHFLMSLLNKATQGDTLSLDWAEKWYSHSIEILPEKYRNFVRTQIVKYVDVMTENEENYMKNLDLYELTKSEAYKKNVDNFIKALKEYNNL
ncbi:DUF6395 domain-containing protein [Alkalithermobacter paradoxus]|uniref:Uncharacterized protein n=1 Tax=Alkalithermobacter paradoxus TaxID=29349 RepID=A0A1V4I9F9_9FIRM|nr:hypothetical protein CLOTH_09150 [[Clostridium] thermoalcaliphilum]